jgi:hypothetical protein
MTFLTLSALLIVLLLWGEFALDPINRLLGIGPRVTDGRSATIRVLALLVVVALVLVLDPEVRLLLLFVDAVGVDFVLLLLAIQGRALFSLLLGSVIMPLIHYLATLGPYPLPLPSRWLLTQHPFWAVYAMAQFLAVASVIACLVAGTVAAGTAATTGFIGKAMSGAFFAAVWRNEGVRRPRLSRIPA